MTEGCTARAAGRNNSAASEHPVSALYELKPCFVRSDLSTFVLGVSVRGWSEEGRRKMAGVLLVVATLGVKAAEVQALF